MAQDNAIEYILKFLVDKGSETQAKKALEDLEKEGVKWNEKAQRFTIAGQFTSGKDVQEILQDIHSQQAQVTAETRNTVKQAEAHRATAEQTKAILEAAARARAQGVDLSQQTFQHPELLTQHSQEWERTKEAAQATADATNDTARGVRNISLGMAGFQFQMVGMSMDRFGKQLLSPIQSYVRYVGMASEKSRQWTESNQRIEQSVVRIGQTMADTALPALEMAADLAETIAELFENHPVLAQAVVVAGLGAIGGGSVLMAGGQIVSALGALKTLGLLTGIGGTASAAGGAASAAAAVVAPAAGAAAGAAGWGTAAAVAGIASSVAAGLLTGGLVNEILARTVGGPFQTTGKIATVGVYELNKLLGKTEEEALKAAAAVARFSGEIEKTGSASKEPTVSTAELDAFIAWQGETVKAERRHSEERSEIVRQAGADRVRIEEQTERRRNVLLKDYNRELERLTAQENRDNAKRLANIAKQSASEEDDLADRRRKVIQDANISIQRMEEDHQRKMRYMREAHLFKVEELLDKQDAFGILSEMRRYNLERDKATEEHNVEMSRRNEDLARRLQEMDVEFAKARERRMQDYAAQAQEAAVQFAQRRADAKEQLDQQLADLEENKKAELLAIQKNKVEKLAALDKSYAEERAKRNEAFGRQLMDLNSQLGGETKLKSQYYAYWESQYKQHADNISAILQAAFKSSITGATTARVQGTRRTGGYTWPGLWQMHDEFVLSPESTRLAEKLVGGRLDQRVILQLMAAGATGGGGGSQLVYQDQRRFDSRIPASDRRGIMLDTQMAIAEGFRRAAKTRRR